MNGRSRHNLLNRTEKSKVARRIAKQRKNVMKVTTDFLNQEKKNLKKPLQSDANIELTPSDIKLIESLGPSPKKKRRINGGGKSKKKKKKKAAPRKNTFKKKKVTPIPFERTRELMKQDPDFIDSDDEDFQDLLNSFGDEESTTSSSSASSFNIPGHIPSEDQQKEYENEFNNYIFKQEAARQFNEQAALARIEEALAKGQEAQKKKSGKGGRRTRRKRRSRRKRKTRRKKRKRKTRRKKN